MKRLLYFLLLCAMLCRVAFASPEQWVEVRGPHFVVLSDAGEKQARHIVDQFERMRWMFQILFSKQNVDPSAPIVVFAVKNTKGFQALEPSVYLAKGQLNLAGYFLKTQDRNYILLRLDAEQEEHPFATVYHEYTHLQFSSSNEWMPLWLNEGLAEFFQNTDIRNKDVLLGQPSVDDILYLRQQRLIPLPVLFRVDASSPYYHEEQKGSIFYAESWALTHYLLVTDREKRTERVTEYMTRLSHHEDPVDAAEKEFGDLKALQSALESYIQASSYKQFILNSAAAPIDESSYSAKAITATEVEADPADVLASVNREKEARDLIDDVLRTDPKNVQVRETLGALELRSGNREEARKWYGEAVKLDSQSYLANYYFAAMSLNGASVGQDESIESSLREAIKLNPDFAPAYNLLANYYCRQPENLEKAHMLSLQAVQLDRGNLAYRLNAANVLAMQAKYTDAAAVLQSALKVSRNPGEVATVQERIAELEQFQQAQTEAANAESTTEMTHANSRTHQVSEPVVIGTATKHRAEATGPRHSALGRILGVVCSYPTVIEFSLEASGKKLSLYNNDFAKIDLTVVGFTPPDSMNPCEDFEGRRARVQYAESSDKSVDGKVLAVELRK
jgi:Flp pilus assembly protein TadD